MQDDNPWRRLNSKRIYDNPWITVYHDEVTTPGGSDGIYGRVLYKNLAVGVIPLDDNYNTWIVGQYRYTLEAYSWEIPEGGCLLSSSPLAAAQRELREETGLSANKWTEIMKLHTSNSVCNEKAILYLAQDLIIGKAHPEDSEDLVVRKLPFSDLVALVHDGTVTDAISVSAVLKLDYMIKNGLI